MDYRIADIVRIKGMKGLFEISDSYEGQGKTYHYAVTNNECDTELFVNKNEIIFVCPVYERQDIAD
jgi:hypothetical protein